jgi:hypothetical protein
MVIAATTDFGSILRQTRQSLGLPPEAALLDDDALLASAARRLAGIFCPCPATTLANRLADSFFKLIKIPQSDLRQRFRDTVDRLVMQGDLLELSGVTTVDEAARNSWIFAAPPSFLMRPSGAAYLLGIAPDENSPVPAKLAGRIKHDGHLRILEPEAPDERLDDVLSGLGLLPISEETWLKPPREESAPAYAERLERQLATQGPSGSIAELTILDPTRPANFYRDRWVEPKMQTGRFVARRPQASGANIWGFVTLVGGESAQFLDFPLRGARYRGCDAAWRLQFAIDANRGAPQQFRLRPQSDGGVVLDLFGPVPMWAERRLSLIGKAVRPEKAMLSFWLPLGEVKDTVAFFDRYLWMSQKNN